ncbi:hypothetical protein C0W52_05200 [Photobacterium kishitanii]|uniref:Uncharacterized protein n=2 Tax=Photobacterium kishitanii TaxID=318456 RepID=A0AAX0YQZ5_9GAMM|nr:hypothetical protein [Photobacterium kishitanii]KJG63351.1 hypothetical protein UA40_22400 [Photobacterium kishitanii]PSX16969.1 hypothetical protein C0W70_21805 [Photobacterium kishitanii]PSX29403.1 hypothetical protein C0W52_05200 [Photobacterium kishitanii]PSX33794.1 hypothetical protein C0W39_09105 [Photobacterium kishitanii]PSX39136.1 hypothetical protein C0W53_21620 [Photobacterium kishitanii]
MNNSESSSSTAPQTVTLLPPPDKQPFGAEQVLFHNIKTCAKDVSEIEYKDIAYFIEGNAFYLLDDTACDYFAEAEKVFQGKKSPEELMNTLAQSNTLNGLLSADITSFIAEEDKKDYQELEKWLDNPQPHLREMTNAYAAAEWVKVQKEKRQVILDKAQRLAELQGYTFEDGLLYSYREPKIQKAIKKYLKAREIFLKEAELTPQTQLETLKERLESLNRFYIDNDKLPNGYHVNEAANYYEKYLSKEIKNTEDKLKELTTSIEELSLLGIATPELALAGTTEDLTTGHESYALYFDYLKKSKAFEEYLHDRLKGLLKATNSYALPPNNLLKREYELLKERQKEAMNIHELAIHNIFNMSSSLFLLWDAEDYRKKPIKHIVKTDYPLREYILGSKKEQAGEGEFSQLRYISLNSIPQPSNNANKKVPPQENSGETIERILKAHVRKLTIEKTWFNERGLFNVDAFLSTLKSENIVVKSFSEQSNLNAWGEAVKQVLFSAKLKKRLSPFDDSKQAQFLRMTMLSLDTGVGNPLEISGTKSNGKITAIEVLPIEAKSELILAKGEVNIVKMLTGEPFIKVPNKEISDTDIDQIIKLKYSDKGQEKIINFQFGAYQALMYCKAWGFAGASIALGSKIEFGAEGFMIPDVFQVNDEQLKHDLELGLKAGLEVGGFLLWYPPSGYPDFLVDKTKRSHQLIKGALKLESSITVKVPVRFRFANKKLSIGLSIGPPSTKLSFEGEINPSMVGACVWQFQRLLRQANYHRIDIVEDDETFKQLSLLSKGILYTQLNIGLFLAEQKDTFDQILDIFERSSAGLVAYTLIYGDDSILAEWTRLLIPEALGPLLSTLVSEPKIFNIVDTNDDRIKIEKDEALLMQQLALCKVIHWLGNGHIMSAEQKAATRQMQKALERMNPNSKVSKVDDVKKHDFLVNRRTILNFMQKEFFVDMSKDYNYKNANDLKKHFKNNRFKSEFNALTIKLFNTYLPNKDKYASAAFDEGLSLLNNGRH